MGCSAVQLSRDVQDAPICPVKVPRLDGQSSTLGCSNPSAERRYQAASLIAHNPLADIVSAQRLLMVRFVLPTFARPPPFCE